MLKVKVRRAKIKVPQLAKACFSENREKTKLKGDHCATAFFSGSTSEKRE